MLCSVPELNGEGSIVDLLMRHFIARLWHRLLAHYYSFVQFGGAN